MELRMRKNCREEVRKGEDGRENKTKKLNKNEGEKIM